MYLKVKNKLRNILFGSSYKGEYRRTCIKFLINKFSLKRIEYEYDLVFVFYISCFGSLLMKLW